jgi:predicted exporter
MRKHRLLPLALWLAALLICAVVIAQTRVVADLSAFMPRAPTARQQMLMDQLKDGIIARLILVGIEGGDAVERARLSRELAATLRTQPAFVGVQNGDADISERDRRYIFDNRYLLSPAINAAHFDEAGLRAAISTTLEGLSSSAGLMLKSLLPRDPTGETLALLSAFEGSEQPESIEGVWASRDGTRALLLIQTQADGSDIAAQAQTIDGIRATFNAIPERQADTHLLLSGTSVFSVSSRELIESEVHRLAIASLVLVSTLLLLVYRSPLLLALSLLPVLTGALVGVAAVSVGFGQVHGLTLGFGTTLIGEAVDYAIYLFIQRPNEASAHKPQWAAFWRTLWLGVATSLAGFLVLIGSGFPGLAQLGLYSSSGLVAAVLVTRFVLPALAPQTLPVRDLTRISDGLQRTLARARKLRWLLALPVFAAIAVIALHEHTIWNRNLSALNPVPKAAQQLDAALRHDLGGVDMRYLVVFTAPDREQALQGAERAGAVLSALTREGVIAGFNSPASVLPSEALQRARRAALPEAAALRTQLDAALIDLPLRSARLEGFLSDVERSRSAELLTRKHLDGTSSALLVDSLLIAREHDMLVLMPLRPAGGAGGEIDIERIESALKAITANPAINDPKSHVTRHVTASAATPMPRLTVIDILAETTSLFDNYLHEVLVFSGIGALTILLLLLGTLRSARRTLRVAIPLACAVLCVTAGTLAAGIQLTLLHLVGLLLVVAVGSNYALFFDSGTVAGSNASARGKTTVSLFVANLTTVGSFGLLGLSSVPILAILGTTVGAGALLALVFSALLARESHDAHAH